VEDSLEVITGRGHRHTPNSGDFETTSTLSHDNDLDSLRLVRRSSNTSFQGKGYLFLAIVFCMMCCSSLLVKPMSVINRTNLTKLVESLPSFDGGRKLMFDDKEPKVN